MTSRDWRDRANCRGKDPNLFTPPGEHARNWNPLPAIGICNGWSLEVASPCPVWRECRRSVMSQPAADRTGVYAGRVYGLTKTKMKEKAA